MTVTIGNTEYNLQDGLYHLVSTIGLACEIGGVPPGQLTEKELLEYGVRHQTGCEVKSNSILTYGPDGECVLYEDLIRLAPTYYTVTFDMMEHGTQVPSQTIQSGGVVSTPQKPTASGYYFSGWYKDSACTEGNEYDFDTPVYSSFTLYAKWELIYTIEYHTNNGNIINNAQTATGTTYFDANLVENEVVSTYSGITKCELRFTGVPTIIPNNAFAKNQTLYTITIPSSITNIRPSAFSGCTNLTGITIPSSVTSINYQTFMDCRKLTSIILPNTLTTIGNNSIRRCIALTNITIPVSVTNINYQAFLEDHSLSNIHYNGTDVQYRNITKGTDWHGGVPTNIVHCSNGDVDIDTGQLIT